MKQYISHIQLVPSELATRKLLSIFFCLHLHEIVEGLYFHCSLSMCLCLCVCQVLLMNKIPAERMHRFGHGFC